MRLKGAALAYAAAALAAGIVPIGRAEAESSADEKQIEALKKEVEDLRRRLDEVAARPAPPAQQGAPGAAAGVELTPVSVTMEGSTSPTAPPAGQAQASGGAAKPKGSLKFYGHLDLGVDYATKGLSGRVQSDGTTPVGMMGWQFTVGSNSSYVGVRGDHELGSPWLKGAFQIEGQVDVSATPGYANANYFGDSRVVGALASRNSFLGLAGPWGSLKAGKTDTPYYLATRRMDPFYGTVGASTSIMGNTGGDNRVEFGYRMTHAVWYDSPKYYGFSLSALVSPGQNRNEDNLIQAAGEPNCTGYYVPGIVNPLCNDGAFGTGWSVAAQYDEGGLYASAAWELHRAANRTVDELTNGGASPDGSIGIANEYAWKLAAEYRFPTETILGFAYERMRRTNPYVNQDYNERDRFGTWLEVVQRLDPGEELSFGWAHAGKTPGDVGTRRSDGSTAAGPVDNVSNMFAFGFRHYFVIDGKPSVYLVYARQVNHNGAHYDLGAGSHGIQYDCHDASPDSANSTSVPLPFGGGRCFAGATLQGISLGMTYNF
jgi:predicted porin